MHPPGQPDHIATTAAIPRQPSACTDYTAQQSNIKLSTTLPESLNSRYHSGIDHLTKSRTRCVISSQPDRRSTQSPPPASPVAVPPEGRGKGSEYATRINAESIKTPRLSTLAAAITVAVILAAGGTMALTTGTAAPAAAPRARASLAAVSCKGMTIAECEGKTAVHKTAVHKRTTVKRKVTVKRKSTTYVHKTTKHTSKSKCRHKTVKRKKCKPKCRHKSGSGHKHNSKCRHSNHHSNSHNSDGQWDQSGRYGQHNDQQGNQDGQWSNQDDQHSQWGQDN